MVRTKPHAAVHVCKSFAEYVPACVVPWLVWPDLCALTRAGLTAPREALSKARHLSQTVTYSAFYSICLGGRNVLARPAPCGLLRTNG